MAEYAGFSYCWFYDSHILWRDCYAAIAMCMEHTTAMRFGPLVTNPDVRDWSVAASMFGSLSKQSGGRFDLGVGRGDSSHARHGQEAGDAGARRRIHPQDQGDGARRGGRLRRIPEPVKFPWAVGHEMPSWIAAYGPLALKTAGESADGVVLQIADPGLCKWFTDQCIEAGKAAGKDMSGFRSMAAAPAYFGDEEQGHRGDEVVPGHGRQPRRRHRREIRKGFRSQVPKSLTSPISRSGAATTIPSTGRPTIRSSTSSPTTWSRASACWASLTSTSPRCKSLQAAGVTQFNIYLDSGDEEEIIAGYGRARDPGICEGVRFRSRCGRVISAEPLSASLRSAPLPKGARNPSWRGADIAERSRPQFLAPLGRGGPKGRRGVCGEPAKT
jgi:hypothetical protein